jgi:hypothetical protein
VWVPAHYVWTPCGCVFVEGYWDYTLRDRGLLFAPVRLDFRVCFRPRWFYRPSFVVYDNCLYGALFIRPGFSCYYFGDYFDVAYRRAGFVSWVDFRMGRGGFDPLFTYYRWQNRGDRRWEVDLRGLYVARFNGTAPRPPRTFVQQTTLIQNLAVTKNVTHVTNVTVVAPLSQVNRSVVKLQPVPKEKQLEAHQHAQLLREASRQRSQVEVQVLAKNPAPLKATDAPHVAKMDLPRPPTVVHPPTTGRTPPPLPIKPEFKPLPVPNKPVVKPATGASKVEKHHAPPSKPASHEEKGEKK